MKHNTYTYNLPSSCNIILVTISWNSDELFENTPRSITLNPNVSIFFHTVLHLLTSAYFLNRLLIPLIPLLLKKWQFWYQVQNLPLLYSLRNSIMKKWYNVFGCKKRNLRREFKSCSELLLLHFTPMLFERYESFFSFQMLVNSVEDWVF